MKEMWEQYGFRIFYAHGIEKRWFEGSRTTPYESVFYADFDDYTKLYSIDKAKV